MSVERVAVSNLTISQLQRCWMFERNLVGIHRFTQTFKPLDKVSFTTEEFGNKFKIHNAIAGEVLLGWTNANFGLYQTLAKDPTTKEVIDDILIKFRESLIKGEIK